jgi:hypothetical protein
MGDPGNMSVTPSIHGLSEFMNSKKTDTRSESLLSGDGKTVKRRKVILRKAAGTYFFNL